jgi:hypothetical protein
MQLPTATTSTAKSIVCHHHNDDDHHLELGIYGPKYNCRSIPYVWGDKHYKALFQKAWLRAPPRSLLPRPQTQLICHTDLTLVEIQTVNVREALFHVSPTIPLEARPTVQKGHPFFRDGEIHGPDDPGPGNEEVLRTQSWD